jgi:hypothetical protein
LKRDEINKKGEWLWLEFASRNSTVLVLGSSKNFKIVYDKAQAILQKTFGLALQELPSKAGLDQEIAEAAAESNKAKKPGRSQAAQDEDELEEARKAITGKKRGALPFFVSKCWLKLMYSAAATGSKSYILRSVLDEKLIELANKTHAEILEEEAVLDFGSGDFFGDGAGAGINDGVLHDDDDDWDDNVELHPRTHGSILSWTQTDQLGSLGILYVILALILVNGKVVQESMLFILYSTQG